MRKNVKKPYFRAFAGHKPEICLYIGDGNEAVFVFIVSKALSSRFGLSRFIRYLVPFPHGIRSGFQNKLFCVAIQLVLLCESSYFAWENNLISQAKQFDLETAKKPFPKSDIYASKKYPC